MTVTVTTESMHISAFVTETPIYTSSKSDFLCLGVCEKAEKILVRVVFLIYKPFWSIFGFWVMYRLITRFLDIYL